MKVNKNCVTVVSLKFSSAMLRFRKYMNDRPKLSVCSDRFFFVNCLILSFGSYVNSHFTKGISKDYTKGSLAFTDVQVETCSLTFQII